MLGSSVAFNHYAKLKRILAEQPPGWYVKRIDEPTRTKNFRGEQINYEHYYRLYADDGTMIKYGKFQQLDKLASVLGVATEDLPIVS